MNFRYKICAFSLHPICASYIPIRYDCQEGEPFLNTKTAISHFLQVYSGSAHIYSLYFDSIFYTASWP